MSQIMKISICTFNNGEFDVMVRDAATGEEITFSGEKKLSEKEFDLVDRLAPSCVWTTYTTEQQ